jgi:protease IV
MKKSTRLFLLFFILSFIFFICLATVLGIYLFSRTGVMGPPKTLVFNIPLQIAEIPQTPGISALFGPRQPTLFETTRAIRRAARDEGISEMLVQISFVGLGWAQIQEIRDSLEHFKESGKPVHVYLEAATNRELYLASVADKIYMPPETITMLGLLSQTTFYRETLDKIKIQPQFEHVGDYKSASDVLMRKEMSEEHRQAINSELDSIYGQIVSNIAAGRKIEDASVERIFDAGLLSPKQLSEAGIIDEIVYPDEMYPKIGIDPSDDSGYLFLNNYALKQDFDIHFGRKIAVVFINGVISTGRSSQGGWSGDVAGADTIGRQLRDIREDSSIAAVVLRINSPGGSGYASDLIWREVQLTSEKKPVVVSMSDLAASGGYYIAMPADYIYAQPATLTGSIGVIAGKLVADNLYDWMGMNVVSLKRGENADFFSETHAFSEDQKEMLRDHIEEFYQVFVRKAADGRGMTYEEMHKYAQGRVWTGELAKLVGLVDELGGLEMAIDKAEELVGINPIEDTPLVLYPKEKSFFEQLQQTNQVRMAEVTEEMPKPLKKVIRDSVRAELFENEPFLLLMPSIPEIR